MEAQDSNDALTVDVPPCWSTEIRVDKNRARQLLCPGGTGTLVESSDGISFVLPGGQKVRIVAGPAGVSLGDLTEGPAGCASRPGCAGSIGSFLRGLVSAPRPRH